MPITVSCPACGSRFSLSDDLYRRRVAGSLVKVKCRTCNAEIAVDATEPATMPSHEAPRRHPNPPRPRAITEIGLGTPPPPAALATSTPLPFELPQPPLPLNATVTPLPFNVAAKPLVTTDADSLWADEETIAINLSKTKPPPKPPIARAAPIATETDEPELVDAEEIPVSSSGAPTLDALTLEAGGAHVPHGRPAPDEFLVSFSSGNDSALGAPTIDVTSFAAEIEPSSVDVTLDQEPGFRAERANTVPLFDMHAVLPAASSAPTPTPAPATRHAAAAPVPPRKPAAEPQISEPPARERKFVIAPEVAATANAASRARSRRTHPMVWVGLLAAAGAVGAGFGYRERMRDAMTTESMAAVAAPASTPVVSTQSALPAAEGPTAEPSEATSAVAATASAQAPEAPVAPVAPPVQNVTVGTTRNLAPATVAAVKSSANTTSPTTEPASTTAEAAVDKPALTSKPVEVHNAPPPAAPDTEFDRAAARNALASAATQASSCRKEGDPSGTANLTITFAPSGRVTSAQIQGPPFSGTPTGGCIASTMRRASVPAFSGDYVTVSKTIVVQ